MEPNLAGVGPQTPGIVAGRLAPERIAANFADVAPPFAAHEALVAADRCYFCHDAPCVTACPTAIDIPLFIRQIATGAPEAAAKTIFGANILGGMCARVCPTETLCEEVCVREAAEGKPVEIGRLQRYATDKLMAEAAHPFTRAAPSGKRVAVVGAGPAGLACAHRLALLGHGVTLYDARATGGGLNEFGIAAYKTPGGFAQAEVDWLLGIGGIELVCGRALGRDFTLADLRGDFDAVFLGIGLGGVNALGIAGEGRDGVRPAVEFIAELRQASDLSALPVGRRVVVIGGGMTAVDAGVQSKLLGAEEVTIVYRGGRERMGASEHEQEHALTAGVRIVTGAVPVAVRGNGPARKVDFAYVRDGKGGLEATGETFALAADQVFTAIGQTLAAAPEGLALERGKIRVEGPGRTSTPGVWAGGDCALGGDDLTVTAVAEGRNAAIDIDASLSRQGDIDASLSRQRDIDASLSRQRDIDASLSRHGGTMREIEADVAANYGGGGVLARVTASLRAAGRDPDALRPEDLKPVESLHFGGWQATEELLGQLEIAPGAQALDIGCGLGGTARTLAAQHGAEVWGVDLTPEFVAVAEALSRMAGVTGVTFLEGSAVALPFDAARFDLATLLHVGMNVPDKAAMFAEVARVLRPGGVFAIFDVMRVGDGELGYPMPWAGTAGISFVETPERYAELARAAGFRETARRSRAEMGIAFLETMRDRGPAAAGIPPERLENALAAVRAGRMAPVELILRLE